MDLWARECNVVAVVYLLLRLLAVVLNGILRIQTLQYGPLTQPVSQTKTSVKSCPGLDKKFLCCLFLAHQILLPPVVLFLRIPESRCCALMELNLIDIYLREVSVG